MKYFKFSVNWKTDYSSFLGLFMIIAGTITFVLCSFTFIIWKFEPSILRAIFVFLMISLSFSHLNYREFQKDKQ